MKEWEMYFGLEPWGSLENDRQAGYTRKTLVDVLIAVSGGKRRGKKGEPIHHYTFEYLRDKAREEKKRRRLPQSMDEMKATLVAIFGRKRLKTKKDRN